MGMENVVIGYVGDVTDIQRKVTLIQRLNTTMAKSLGSEFTKNATIVRRELTKISQSAKPIDLKSGKTTSDIRTFTTVLRGANGQLSTVTQNTVGAGRDFKVLNTTVKAGASGMRTFGDNLKTLVGRALLTIPVWLVLRSTVVALTQTFKSSLKFLIDWEYQLAQIRIVGKDSEESIQSLSRSMLSLASSLGISNALLGEGAKLFIQQGKSAKEVIPLLEATAKLSLLTGKTIVESVEDLTAVLNAYNLDAKSSISIVDSMTNVMLNNAITAGDLASAYKQVASSASVLGVSFSGLTGFITAIKEETRDAGGKIGLSLRTMFSRISTTSAEALQQMTGIPLFLDETNQATNRVTPTLRNLEDIISDISLVFDTMGNAQQAQVAKLVAGVRRTNQAIVLFKNFNTAIKSQTEALLGLGKADDAVAKLTDTTKLRITQLTNTWKEFIDTVVDTGAIKGTLDFLKNQIQGLTAILDMRGAVNRGIASELRQAGVEAQRVVDLSKNFQELINRTTNLSRQLGLAKSASEIELIEHRIGIISKEIQEFNKLNPTLAIDIKPTTNAEEFNKQLLDQAPKFVEFAVQGKITLERTELQGQIGQIGSDIDKILKPIFNNLAREMHFSPKEAREFTDEFKALQGIITKISESKMITKDEFELITKFSEKIKFSDDVALGLQRKFKNLDKIQGDLVNISSKEAKFRDEITKQVERDIKLRKTVQQVEEDLFNTEINGIQTGKIRKQILEEQLAILEREGQVLDDNLENQIETIRKTLEQNKAQEKRKGLDLLVNNQLEMLRTQGLLNSEILKAENIYRKQAKLQDTDNEKLARKLEIQREINKEKRLGTDIPSEDAKLFKIAQEQGTKSAERIGDVLAGKTDLDLFLKIGGKDVDTFKKEFSDIFQQEQISRFFKGLKVPDLPTLRGGEGISTAKKFTPPSQGKMMADLELSKAREGIAPFSASINNNISSLDKNTLALEKVSEGLIPKTPVTTMTTAITAGQMGKIIPPSEQKLSIDFNINGKDLNLSGTKEQIKTMLEQAKPGITKIFDEQLDKVFSDYANNVQNTKTNNLKKGTLAL